MIECVLTCGDGGNSQGASGTAAAPEVVEWNTEYDDANRSLTYDAGRLPWFLTAADNRWRVEPIDEHRSRVSLRATVRPRRVIGWLLYLVLRLYLIRAAPRLINDLGHYARTGLSSPRTLRQLADRLG